MCWWWPLKMSPRENHTWSWGLWLLPSRSILPSFLLQMGQPVAWQLSHCSTCKFYRNSHTHSLLFSLHSSLFPFSPPQMILPSFLFFSAGIGCWSWPFSCPQTCLRKRRNRIWAATSGALKLQRNISFSHELPQIFPCTLIGILTEVWRCLLCEMLALLPSVIRTDYKYLWFQL